MGPFIKRSKIIKIIINSVLNIGLILYYSRKKKNNSYI